MSLSRILKPSFHWIEIQVKLLSVTQFIATRNYILLNFLVKPKNNEQTQWKDNLKPVANDVTQ
jgi:hypothetical protein